MKINFKVIVLVISIFLLLGCGKSNLGFSNEAPTQSSQTWQQVDADKTNPAPNKLTVQVEPIVVFDSKSEKISYSYSLTNLPNSQQAAKSFLIGLNRDNPFSIENVSAPEHWEYLIMDQSYFSFPLMDWVSVDSEPPYRKPIYGIKPGETKSGFGLISNGLPDIGNFYIKGWVRAVWDENEDIEHLPPQPSFPENCAKTETVIPVSAPPQTFDFAAFQAKMNGFINKSAELGWISSRGTKEQLLTQFAQITSRGTKSLEALTGFLNLLETSRGKGLNDSAYYLLKVNSQYLQNRLNGKPIPVWPNLKKEKAKDPVSEADLCIDKMVEVASKINNSLYPQNQGKGPNARQIMMSGNRCPVTHELYRTRMYSLHIYPHTFNFTIYCTGKHPGYEAKYPEVSSHDTTLCILKSPEDLKNLPVR